MTSRVFHYDRAAGKVVEGPARRRRIRDYTVEDAYSAGPVLSPIDRQPIASRMDLREHNKRHGVVDVGNDPSMLRERRPDVNPGEGLRNDLERIYSEYDS